MSLLAWTMVHGIAKLAITHRLPFRSDWEILKFGEFVIDQSLPLDGSDCAFKCVDAVLAKGLSSLNELLDIIQRLIPDAELRLRE